MPRLSLRKATEVPTPSRASRAVQEHQRMYEDFVRQVEAGNAGELELQPGETMRGVKVRLRRAATRVGVELQIWDANNKVYFTKGARRGRPRGRRAAR